MWGRWLSLRWRCRHWPVQHCNNPWHQCCTEITHATQPALVGTAERIQAVGVSGTKDRAMIGIADRECICQRIVKRQVATVEIAHGLNCLLSDPGLPGLLRTFPRMIGADRQCADVPDIEMKRQHTAASRVRLLPDRCAVWQADGTWIVKAAYPGQGAKVMIERAVFLHEDDDMANIGQRSREIVRRYGECLLYQAG